MKKDGIVVLSLFDGMSCGRIALERAGIKVDKYFSSEIDKHALKVANHNWPQDEQYRLGDITKVKYENGVLYSDNGTWETEIDLVIGGSPCQSISNLGDGSGLDGKSGLFFYYLNLKDAVKDRNPNSKFLLENVVGNKSAIQEISKLVGVNPKLFNSNLVSAQNRARYYWTNIEYSIPEDKDIVLTDILDQTLDKSSILSQARLRWLTSEKGKECLNKRYAVIDPVKAQCLTARSDASWNSNYVTRLIEGVSTITKLSTTEYEKLQTVPVGYTSCVSTANRYKMLGNGWTVDVIAHILSSLKIKQP